MATLQEILANAALVDTTEFQIGDTKLTMGDLRKLNSAIDSEKRVAAMKRKEAEDLTAQAAELLATLQKTPVPTVAVKQPDGTYDWKTDPLYAPVVAELQTIMAAANDAKAAAEAQRKSLEQISSVYAFERMRGEYDRAGYKDKPFEELAQQAIASKSYDRFGLPTLSPIIEKLTEPSRMEKYAAEKVSAAQKEWEAKQNAAAAAPGRNASARFETKVKSESPVKRIEDITSEMVAADPDVQAAMRGEAVIQ